MDTSATSQISLEEYVLCITQNIPGAKFSTEIGGTEMHDIRPSELLYSKQGLPSVVMCCFDAIRFYFAIVWTDNAVGILLQPYRINEWNYIPDILKNFRIGAPLSSLQDIVVFTKRYYTKPCLYTEALEKKANTRALWGERDD